MLKNTYLYSKVCAVETGDSSLSTNSYNFHAKCVHHTSSLREQIKIDEWCGTSRKNTSMAVYSTIQTESGG